MAQQLDNEGFDTGSNYQFADKMIRPNAPRSMFDLSHLVTRDVSEAGLVFPITLFETLPASDYEISCKPLVRLLPQVVPLMSRQRLYLYAFYSRCPDLWCGFDVFIRKGYSGNEIKTVPTLNRNNISADEIPSWDDPDLPGVRHHSLGDFFGFPIGKLLPGDVYAAKINAMPFMMYLRIWRDYFLNRNFYIEDRRILPDDDSRFRLLDSGEVGSFKDAGESVKVYFDYRGRFTTHVEGAGTEADPLRRVASKGMTYLNSIFIVSPFYHDYAADYFTSALPWPQRGNTPTLSIPDTDVSTLNFNLTRPSESVYPTIFNTYRSDSTVNYFALFGSSIGDPVVDSSARSRINRSFNSWFDASIAEFRATGTASFSGLTITLEALRELAVSQTIMEKMARTDGSYKEFGLTFFGEPSKAAMDYRPTFVGGSRISLLFSEVLQTSQTTSESALGQYAGHGISASVEGQGYLGRVHTDDYGYIMVLGCIMPDTYYSQGLEKMWTRTDQADWFIPERAQLGMQPILNQELYLDSYSVIDSETSAPKNLSLWAWQDCYDEFRYRNNRIGGQIAMSDRKSFYPFTQARKFSSLPNWGKEFARADDVRTDYLAASSESAYICQFDVNVRAVQPLPYRARPASILNGVS